MASEFGAAAGKTVLRSLYRSLLRASVPFSPSLPSHVSGASGVYASLLHRTGASHDWEECLYAVERRRANRGRRRASEEAAAAGALAPVPLPKNWARDLSRSYRDLRREFDDLDDVGDDGSGGSGDVSDADEAGVILFRHLLRELLSGGGDKRWTPDGGGYYKGVAADDRAAARARRVPLMKFPSQTLPGEGGLTLRQLIRREFRAPSADDPSPLAEEGDDTTTPGLGGTGNSTVSALVPAPSSSMDDGVRLRTAFLALSELNRKLAWAERMGLPPSQRTGGTDEESQKEERWRRDQQRRAQAAKGVSRFGDVDGWAEERSDGAITCDASDVAASLSSSHCLKTGTYLAAHPFMRGTFSRTVIVLLDHVTEGGTYGLIVNRPALEPSPVMIEGKGSGNGGSYPRRDDKDNENEEGIALLLPTKRSFFASGDSGGKSVALSFSSPSSTALQPVTLLRAVQGDCLPETVRAAFGDSPVREGGPVNASVQMLHRAVAAEGLRESEKGSGSGIVDDGEACGGLRIGGTMIPASSSISTATSDADDSVCFGGDIIQASQAVIEGFKDRDDFSFVIGASCWAPGMLEGEIEQGCWLPFRGPPQMAMTGMCDHDDLPSPENDGDGAPGIEDNAAAPASRTAPTKLSKFPSQPSDAAAGQTQQQRPHDDLWLSVMCALGEGEADLAHLAMNRELFEDDFGDACDTFEG